MRDHMEQRRPLSALAPWSDQLVIHTCEARIDHLAADKPPADRKGWQSQFGPKNYPAASQDQEKYMFIIFKPLSFDMVYYATWGIWYKLGCHMTILVPFLLKPKWLGGGKTRNEWQIEILPRGLLRWQGMGERGDTRFGLGEDRRYSTITVN